MVVLPIVEVSDPRLRLVSRAVPAVDEAVRTLIADMFETMYAAHGIGLAGLVLPKLPPAAICGC